MINRVIRPLLSFHCEQWAYWAELMRGNLVKGVTAIKASTYLIRSNWPIWLGCRASNLTFPGAQDLTGVCKWAVNWPLNQLQAFDRQHILHG